MRRHLRRLEEKQGFDEVLAAAATSLSRIADILRSKTGNDFHGYKQNTFLRACSGGCRWSRSPTSSAYVDFLRNDRGRGAAPLQRPLDRRHRILPRQARIRRLENEIVPKLFEGKDAGQQVRVWVPGCATGEEAYSIAILLREHMAKVDLPPQVQIFATDIDGRALAAAARRPLPAPSRRDDQRAPGALVRAARATPITWSRSCGRCASSRSTTSSRTPRSRSSICLLPQPADLSQCRIAEPGDPAIPLRASAGPLPVPRQFRERDAASELFVPIDRRARIFKKLETDTAAAGISDHDRRREAPAEAPPLRRYPPRHRAGAPRTADRERYAPAYVITDSNFQVAALFRAHRPLSSSRRQAPPRSICPTRPPRSPAGPARGAEPRAGDQRAGPCRAGAARRQRPAHSSSTSRWSRSGGGRQPQFRRPVQGRPGAPIEADEGKPNALGQTEHVERIEGELRATRERLQATIEELESTNEELKSSNEEYQSLNEELQSANEELETSREELQSVNEELTTVNGELAHRVQELTRATSDLQNFLESTQIATVFLDNDLRVMNFTPAITQVLHLVETDIGRPIAHIKARIPIEELYDDIRGVLRTLASAERELRAPDSGTRYIVRILPYRSIDNFIAGVVITFVDITALPAPRSGSACCWPNSSIGSATRWAWCARSPVARPIRARRSRSLPPISTAGSTPSPVPRRW